MIKREDDSITDDSITRNEKPAKEWQYDAFISYRHTEPDSFVAKTLHKYLENFKLPRSVARLKKPTGDKTRIHRVFRDREELPLVSNLADPITEALEQSEFLIVICSPRLNESMWCRKEIETFIQMHDRDHVLAVLVEGEPETSFPEELLYREKEEVAPDGSVVYKRVPVEPLAADVRGATNREITKKIKSELLRLAAPMFDCNYDELKQRHREQRVKKTILTSVSVSAVCLLIGLVSTIMALKIQYQSQKIEEGAQLIYEQSEVIAAQNDKVRRQISEANAREALTFLEEGNRMLGLAEGVMAYWNYLPELYTKEDIDKCPSKLIYTLTELLYLYENGTQIRPDRILEHTSAVRFLKISPDGGRLMSVGDSGDLIVWESQYDRAKVSIKPDGTNLSRECQVGFLSEDKILYPQEDALCVLDVETQETQDYPCTFYEGVIPVPDKGVFLVVEDEGFFLVDEDGKASERMWWESVEQGLYAEPGFESAQVVTEDGRILIALELGDRENKRIAVLQYDSVDKEPTVALYPIDYEYVGSLCLEEGSYQHGSDLLYVTSNHSEKVDATATTAGMSGKLQAFDLNSQLLLWTCDVSGDWLYDVGFARREGSNYLLCQKYSEAMLLDRRDGTLIDTFSFGSEVIKIGSYTNTDHFMAFTRDGVWHYLHTERMEDMVGMSFPACTSSNVKEFVIGDGYCVTLPYGSNCVTVYQTARGTGLETFHEGEGSYRQAKLGVDGKLLAAARYGEDYNTCVEMFDTSEQKLLWTYECSYYEEMAFGDFDGDGEESLLIVTGAAYYILDPTDGTVQSTVSYDGIYCEYLGIDESNGVICLESYDDGLSGYRLADGTLLYEDALDDGVTAVCHERPFYATASKETGGLLFYQMGEEDVFMDPKMYGIDVEYLETMFFDEDDDDLYLVYKDGRVVILFVNWNTSEDVHFCGGHGNYTGLSERMIGYEAVEGADFGFLCGNEDAYQIDFRKGQMYGKLAHIHGYLAYDAVSGTLYLHDGSRIYTSPLYDTEEIVDLAEQVLSVSSSYWNYRELVPDYLDDM